MSKLVQVSTKALVSIKSEIDFKEQSGEFQILNEDQIIPQRQESVRDLKKHKEMDKDGLVFTFNKFYQAPIQENKKMNSQLLNAELLQIKDDFASEEEENAELPEEFGEWEQIEEKKFDFKQIRKVREIQDENNFFYTHSGSQLVYHPKNQIKTDQ